MELAIEQRFDKHHSVRSDVFMQFPFENIQGYGCTYIEAKNDYVHKLKDLKQQFDKQYEDLLFRLESGCCDESIAWSFISTNTRYVF